jgi:hypothetical protein
MSTFTDRNLVPRAPSGAAVPTGARRSIFSWFQGQGISTTIIWETFLREEALGTWQELEEDLRARFGDQEADAFTTAMKAHFRRDGQRIVHSAMVNPLAEPALLALPAPWFLNGVEYALRMIQYDQFGGVNEINRVFQKVGASYRFDYSGNAEWHGDTGVHEAVIRPALDALGDPRLAGCASEFHPALNHLRGGTAKDREDAVEESGKAVESAMKAVLDARKVKRTGKEAAYALFDRLVDNGVCPREAENAVLGAARIRNNLGAHGTGALPRVIPDGVPELAVNSAATAIRYLADQLP